MAAVRTPGVPHRDAYPRVRRTVVEVPAPVEWHQTFYERRALGVLPGPLVGLGRLDERLGRAGDQLDGICRIEERLSSGVDPGGQRCNADRAAVSRVVDQNDSPRGENRGGTGLDEPGVEVPGPGGEDLHQLPVG